MVTEGDTRAEVRHKCGAPDSVESWEEERIGRDFSSGLFFDERIRRYRENRIPLLVNEHVRVEEWTYNLGSTRFIRYLRFENGILTDIFTGDRGY